MSIWGKGDIWPNDFEDFTFLARAIQYTGKSMFADLWADDDSEDRAAILLVDKKRVSNDDINHNRFVKNKILLANGITPDERESTNKFGMRFKVLSAEQDIQARELIQKHNDHIHDARSRSNATKEALLGWLTSGKVISATRKHEGGEITPIPKEWWNSEKLQHRFATCKIDPDKPFELVESQAYQKASWLFINKGTLRHAVGAMHVATPIAIGGSGPETYVSDILEISIELGALFKTKLADNIKKDALKDDIKEFWRRRFGEAAPTITVDSIATVLKDTESQKGGSAKFCKETVASKLRTVHISNRINGQENE